MTLLHTVGRSEGRQFESGSEHLVVTFGFFDVLWSIGQRMVAIVAILTNFFFGCCVGKVVGL
jgi:hypothetical protein